MIHLSCRSYLRGAGASLRSERVQEQQAREQLRAQLSAVLETRETARGLIEKVFGLGGLSNPAIDDRSKNNHVR